MKSLEWPCAVDYRWVIDVLRIACLLSFVLVLPTARLIRSDRMKARAIEGLAAFGLSCALLAYALR